MISALVKYQDGLKENEFTYLLSKKENMIDLGKLQKRFGLKRKNIFTGNEPRKRICYHLTILRKVPFKIVDKDGNKFFINNDFLDTIREILPLIANINLLNTNLEVLCTLLKGRKPFKKSKIKNDFLNQLNQELKYYGLKEKLTQEDLLESEKEFKKMASNKKQRENDFESTSFHPEKIIFPSIIEERLQIYGISYDFFNANENMKIKDIIRKFKNLISELDDIYFDHFNNILLDLLEKMKNGEDKTEFRKIKNSFNKTRNITLILHSNQNSFNNYLFANKLLSNNPKLRYT